MNYASKLDGKSFIDGVGAHANGHAPGDSVSPHTTHAPADAIVVPDAHLLFNGDFKRSGVDLIISADDEKLVLHDYFKGEKRAALASPDGAHLTGDIVKALAGHVEYAQAADGSASVNKVIGHVTKLVGSATAIRNGVSIILNQGDNVEKGDVVQSGAGSTLGITFIDGTVFGLSSNARMVLNEMVYDPNGSNNSSLLSLVAGTITFVAGETAKHGDMKIDTPVATMGIRGTAVLVEIDFDTAGQNGLPDTKFQVLVEPDGTTGSYILFDKVTLTPFAIVDKAGTQFSFSNGNFSQSLTGLTPEVQKLITDVFAQKFTDNSNPRTFDHHTDTPIPDILPPIKVGNVTITPVILLVNAPTTTSSAAASGSGLQIEHISQAPGGVIVNALGQASTDFKITEIPGVTGSTAPDQVIGAVNFVDINAGDHPTVSAKFDGSTYTDPHGNTLPLNSQQLADIKAVEVDLAVTQTPGNNNNGSASWSYTVPDGSFDFLAAGETLQLTYTLTVDNNYAPNDQKTDLKFTITITGTNDAPVITTGAQTINFIAGKGTVGGDLAPSSETSGVKVNHPTALSYTEKGTLAFTDPDLTDTHTIVSTGLTGDLTAASLSGTTLDLAALEAKYPGPFQTFESALTASIGTDSTGTGTGTINWSFAELPAFVADFIASGQILTLTYTVEVQDSQGAISTQTITVTITGNDNPAVVWKDTAPAPPTGALWSDGANWGTGNAPTISDDTIIITNQLQPNAPTYPVVINAAASAKTLLMDDPTGLLAPELDNHSSLTIAGGLTMSADAILKNFGDLSVGSLATLLSISGLAEFSDHAVLNNSGTIELARGGDFIDQSSITNSGTIEIVGDTLNVDVAIANAGGTIKVDDGAELKLNGATIHGGTINNGTAGGTVVASGTVIGNIDVTASSKIDGNAILNHGDVTIESGVILTLDNVTVNGTTFVDTASGAIIQIDDGSTLTLNGVTINGGTINDGTASGTVVASGTVLGNIDVTGDSKISNASLNYGIVTVDAKLTLDNVTVTGSTFADTASGAIIQVDDGTKLTLAGATIHGGTINDGTATGTVVASGTVIGNIDVTASTKIDSNASLNHGDVTIESGVILTLDNVAVNGTTFADTASGATIQIDDGTTLTLNGITINGGTINDGTATGTLIASGTVLGNIDIAGDSTISGASLNHGVVTVDAKLTLDNVTVTGSTFADTASGAIIQIDDGTKLTLAGATIHGGTINDGTATGTVVASGTVIGNIDVTASSKIDSNASLNHGDVTIESGVILTLDNVAVNGTTFADTARGATIQIDDGSTLTLNGATINGGTINDGTATGTVIASGTVLGNIDVTGDSTINGAGLNHGVVTVDAKLTLDNVTVTGTTFADTASGAIIQIDDGTKLTLAGATIHGGAINDGTATGTVVASGTVIGNIDVTASSKIDGNAILNHGDVTIESGVILTLDNVAVNGTTFADTASGATIQIDDGTTLTLNGVTINGGTINDGTANGTGNPAMFGNIVVTGDSTISNANLNNGTITTEPGISLTLTNDTVTGTSIVVDGTAKTGSLTLQGGTTLNSSDLTIDSADQVALNGVTLTGGTISGSGTIDVTGGSTINGNASLGNAGVTIESGVILTLDNVKVTGTAFTDTATGAVIQIDDGTTLTLSGASIDGGTINDGTASGSVLVLDGPVVFGSIDVTGASTISNASLNNGAVTIANGASLTLTNVTVTGATITDIKAPGSLEGTLILDGATIDGGTINDGTSVAGGIVDVTASSSINGASLNNGGVTIESGVILTLDNVTVTGTTFTDTASGAVIQIDDGAKLTLSGVTIDGGAIDDGTTNGTSTESGTVFGNIDVTGNTKIDSNAHLNNGYVTIESGKVLTLDNVTVTGTTFSDTASGAIIQADDGTTLTLSGVTIDGGAINNGTVTGTSTESGTVFGNIDVTGNTKIDSNARLNNGYVTIESGKVLTLDNVTVAETTFSDTASGAVIQVDDGTTLTLSGVTIDGGIINDGTIVGGLVASTGLIDVTGNTKIDSNASLNNGYVTVESGKILTLDNVTVTGTTFTDTASGAVIQIDNGATLTLSGVTIDGGAINDGTIVGGPVALTGLIDVTGNTKIDSNAHLNNGYVTIESGKVLTLDNVTVTGTTFTDTASGAIIQIDDGTTLTLAGVTIDGGAIDDGTVTGTSTESGTVFGNIDVTGNTKIDSNAHLNNGYVTVESGKILTLDNVTVAGTTFTDTASGAVIQVDDGTTLTLSGATIDGGIINDGTIVGGAVASTGLIDVTGNSKIDSNAHLNNGYVTIESGKVLTLDNVTATGTAFTDTASGAVIQIDNGATLTLSGVTIDGGAINDGTIVGGPVALTGLIDVTGNSKIYSNASLNNGYVTIESGKILTFDNVTVNGTAFNDTASGATLSVDGNDTLTLQAGVVISGGTLANSGTVKIEASTGTLDGVAVTGSGIIQVDGGNAGNGPAPSPQPATLLLDDGSSMTGGTLSIGLVGTVDVEYGSNGPSHGATFDGVTVNNNNGGTFEVGKTSASGAIVALFDDGTAINGGTLTIGAFGTVDVEYGANGPLHGAIFDGATVNNSSGGTFEVGETSASGTVIALFEDGAAVTNGALTIGSFGTVDVEYGSNGPSHGATFNNVTVNISSGGAFEVGQTSASGTIVAILEGGTSINNGPLTIGSTGALEIETAAGATLNNVQATNHGSIEVVSGSVLTLDGDTNITNTGATITVDSGGMLVLNGAGITGGTISDNGTIEVTGATTLTGVTFNGTATDTIDNTSTLTLGAGGLMLGVSTGFKLALDGTGTLALNGQTLEATAPGMTLENDGNTVSGAGQIGDGTTKDLTLDNASGTTEAFGGTLKIDTGNGVTNAGTLEANGAKLVVTTKISNSGLIEAVNGGTLDLKGGSLGLISWDGGTPAAGTNGIVLGGSGATLVVDADGGRLTLEGMTGHGAVSLGGGTIKGNGVVTGETLENANNFISGSGQIGIGTDLLTLQNDLNGVIDANVSGQIISIDTVATSNAGLIEATNGGAVDFANTITNTNNITASGGGKIAFSNDTIVNTGTIHVDGSVTASQMIIQGTVTLESATGTPTGTGSGQVILTGNSLDGILSNLSPATLVNVDNTISGSGALGDAHLTVQNDQYGVIDATGMLALNAGNVINSGLLEATSGGTLQIENSVSNSGTIEANGGTVYVAAGATITGTPTVTITGGGLAEFQGSVASTLLLNATFSGAGTLQLDNAQHYGGTISGFGADDKIDLVDLAYTSGETDVWNAATHTLTITSGTQTETLHFAATDNFSQNDFAITSDANGHTELMSNAGLSQPQVTMTGLDSAGNAIAGDSVTANFSSPSNPGSVTYTWLEAGHVVQTGSSDVFTPGVADAGKVLDVVVGFGGEQITNVAGNVVAPPAVSFNDPGGATTNSGTPLTLNSLGLTFADAGSDSFTVTLTAGNGTLSLTTPGTLTEGGSGGTLTLTGTLADIDTALGHGLVYTATSGFFGNDTISMSAVDGAFSSNTATLNVSVTGPVLNSFALSVSDGGTTVLTNSDFSVSDPGFTNFTYSVQNVTYGEFEVFNGTSWVAATGGFTTAQIAAGHVEFVQDGSDAAPTFTIAAGDGTNVSPAIAPTVSFSDAPVVNAANITLSSNSPSSGFDGEYQGAAVTYADGHLYLSFNNGADTGSSSDNADILGFNTGPNGSSGSVFSYAWGEGDFLGIATDGNQIYAAGESYPGFGLTTDTSGGIETKAILARFAADGTGGSDPYPALGTTAHTFYNYSGVESFQNVLATTQNGNTIVYAFGAGQPASYDGYVIGEYDSNGTLLHSATDPLAVPGSSDMLAAVDFNGAIWAVGNSWHASLGESTGIPTVWTASYDLSSIVTHEDTVGSVTGSFNGVAVVGNSLLAVGNTNGGDYLVASYNADGSVAWSETFGDGGTDVFNSAVAVNGELYVVGSSTNGGSTEGVLMEIDPSTGHVLSTVTYDPEQYNSLTSIATDGQHLYVADISGSSATQNAVFLLTYDVGGPTATTVEDTAVNIQSLAVSDPAAGSSQIEVTLAAGHGTMTLVNANGLASEVGSGTGTLELFGTQAEINTALATGVVYDPTSNYTGSDTLTITANDLGHNASGVAQSTSQTVGIGITSADVIADGATHTVSAPTGDTIMFATGNGTLELTQPSTFSGEIAGITGTGDVLDMLSDFNAATTTATTGVGSYNSTFNTTTLTVTDSSNNHVETFTLAGNLSSSLWIVTDDTHGGVNIVDPPATTPAVSTITASAPNQTLTGNAASDTFVFNFANVGQATVTNFHAAADTLQFSNQVFANLQAALNATQDDGHGNTVITIDAHDAITLSGVVKAQLHASDFHFA